MSSRESVADPQNNAAKLQEFLSYARNNQYSSLVAPLMSIDTWRDLSRECKEIAINAITEKLNEEDKEYGEWSVGRWDLEFEDITPATTEAIRYGLPLQPELLFKTNLTKKVFCIIPGLPFRGGTVSPTDRNYGRKTLYPALIGYQTFRNPIENRILEGAAAGKVLEAKSTYEAERRVAALNKNFRLPISLELIGIHALPVLEQLLRERSFHEIQLSMRSQNNYLLGVRFDLGDFELCRLPNDLPLEVSLFGLGLDNDRNLTSCSERALAEGDLANVYTNYSNYGVFRAARDIPLK